MCGRWKKVNIRKTHRVDERIRYHVKFCSKIPFYERGHRMEVTIKLVNNRSG
ncbi:MAG: hypothetical protein A4E55_00323 [Pelotomaculum sp. PtaU1.Bin035]|nr:MAG: hypothetical protein A4E55_00323 [Pelotomaculum sp. PtaU1.Bin035]